MGVVNALPDRPLRADELTDLNLSDRLELAVSVEEDAPAESLLLATGDGVKGLVFDDDGWHLVETVTLGGETERIDGLQACEAAILSYRADGERAGADDSTDENTD